MLGLGLVMHAVDLRTLRELWDKTSKEASIRFFRIASSYKWLCQKVFTSKSVLLHFG